jgi:hypothetical protein
MAEYFSKSCVDYGWILPDGTIASGLLMPNVDSHGPMAIKLRIGGWSNAINDGCIRWGLFKDRETIFVEYRITVSNELKPERSIALLKKYTGAKIVVKEEDL